jgi:hypothetical protein
MSADGACITIAGTFDAATTSTMAASRSPLTSLTTIAPAATAAAATAARRVSMLTATPLAASSSITGTTRRSSSSAATGTAPGRVDSPPTSIRWAPSSTSWRAWATARSCST